MHEAQICRNDELIPKDLFPRISNAGTVSPIRGPAIYHGQGCFKNSIILHLFLNYFMVLLWHTKSVVGTSVNLILPKPPSTSVKLRYPLA